VIGTKAAIEHTGANVVDSDCRERHGCTGFEARAPVPRAGSVTNWGKVLVRDRVHEQEQTEPDGGDR
jgi:hypothetical protein